MRTAAFDVGGQLAAVYLMELQALASEIDVAMEAIATNKVTSLHESVARQERLCDGLRHMAMTFTLHSESQKTESQGDADIAVRKTIKETIDLICKQNVQYAALLRHSGRSIEILTSLCRSCIGEFSVRSGIKSKRQTWSCEV